MKVLRLMASLAVVLTVGFCIGCGDGENKVEGAADAAMEEVGEAAEGVAGMAEEAAESAQGMMEEIKAELAAKEDELAKLKEQMSGLSPTDLAGKAGKELKAKSEALSAEIQQLKDKLASSME